jgi:hypothetical protein
MLFRTPLQCTALIAAFGLLLLAAAGRAQEEKPDIDAEATKRLLKKAEEEYRLFVKRPETVLEYWAAMKYEIQLGKFDLAGLHLKLLLDKYEKDPKDGSTQLVRIEAAEGLSAILGLRNIKKWSDHPPFQKEAVQNVERLIDRVTTAIEAHLGDPARIQKFIKRLDAPTPEERAFARVQLMKSGVRAVPYLVEALRVNHGKALYNRIRDLMLEMDSAIVPGYLEIFRAQDAQDAKEPEPRLTLLDITVKRGDERIVPYLWHLSASPKYPENVRKEAKRALAVFLKSDVVNLPPAKIALTELAQDYYYHRVRFPGKQVVLWRWDGSQIATQPIKLTPAQAEELFGTRYAREALDLDPKYQPAQVILLSLLLEQRSEPDRTDKLLLEPMPADLRNLLVTTDPELVGAVLERALDDHNVPVIVATVQALGERGDPRFARLSAGGTPRGLLRALSYPDRRVQYAAAQATVRMPSVPPVAAARVVDIFRRFLAADPATPKALAAYVPADQAPELRKQLKAAGYEAVLVRDLKEGFDKLRESADYDLVVLHRGLPIKELPFVLAQLRGDTDQGSLPVLVVAKDRQPDLEKIVRKYRAVEVVPELALGMTDEFKAQIDSLIRRSSGAKLTADERKELSRASLDALWRMARGEYAGYDVRPAMPAIVAALRSPDSALLALEILGRLPGSETQHRLAGVVLDPAAGKLRVPAAKELNRHMQKYGLLLGKKYAGELRTAYQAADPTLKGELAVSLGLLHIPPPQQVGAQLFQFFPAPPMPPPEKKDEKEK